MKSQTELISVPCPLCKHQDHKLFRYLNGHPIVRCNKCDFRFANPRPSEDKLLRAYTKSSLDDEISFATCLTDKVSVEHSYSWAGLYVLKRLRQKLGIGRMIDIGAGQGWAVMQALSLGYDAYGFEFGDERAFHKDRRIKDRIFSDEKILSTKSPFDFLFSSAVLEHVFNPKDFLLYWMKTLKPGGYFTLAAIPNVDSYFIKLGLESWDGNFPYLHLNYFNRPTLERLINDVGGKVVDFYTLGIPVSFSIRNITRQKFFEENAWGDNSRNWSFAKKMNDARHKKGGFAYNLSAQVVNQLMILTGGGANLYFTFQKTSE